MSNRVIRLYGAKHSVPRCFENLLGDLEAFDGIKEVGSGKFGNKGHSLEEGIIIKYWNAPTSKMKITARRGSFSQDFYLKIEGDKLKKIEEYLTNYKF